MDEGKAIDWGQQVRELRLGLGVTVQELARRVGVASSCLGAIERGQLLPDSEQEAVLDEYSRRAAVNRGEAQ